MSYLSKQVSSHWDKIIGSRGKNPRFENVSYKKPKAHKPFDYRKPRISAKELNLIANYLSSHGIFTPATAGKRKICENIISLLKEDISITTKIRRDKLLVRFFAKISSATPLPKPTPKTSYQERKAFYESDAWRELRYKALKFYGRKCMVCGAIPHAENNVRIHVDHIKPRSLYPELELSFENLQILCEDCNLGKSNKDEIDYRTTSP